MIKATIAQRWSGINFQNVLFVLTVPAEYSCSEMAVIRNCVFNAGLIEEKCSKNLQFITERK